MYISEIVYELVITCAELKENSMEVGSIFVKKGHKLGCIFFLERFLLTFLFILPIVAARQSGLKMS